MLPMSKSALVFRRLSAAPLALRLVIALLALSGLSGCAGCDRRASDGLRGEVRADGSSTVFPLSEAVAEEFMRDHPGVRVTVGVSGTGGGFGRFGRGETDVSNASRPIEADEIEKTTASGVSFIELPVAYDGLAVVANPENTWATCLSVAELKAIWEPGSQIESWAQVRPGFPDRPLILYGPGTDSGTYDYFTEAVVGGDGGSRTDYSASEDDNVLVQGIEGDVGALGFFGLAYYEASADRLSLVGVDPTTAGPARLGNCVQPTPATVSDGRYAPLARPEFIYVRTSSLQRPAVRAFIETYLNLADELAREVGAVPLPPATMNLVRARLAARTEGSAFTNVESGTRVDEVLRASSAPASR